MSVATSFSQVLEAAEELSSQDQEALIEILYRRLAQSRRKRIVEDVQESRRAFEAGQCRSATPEDLMREILS